MAYISNTPQRVGIPLQPDRVVWITYKNHFGALTLYHIKQPVKVHRILSGAVDSQRIVHRAAPVALYHRTERVIDRRLYHYGIAGFRKVIDAKAQPLFKSGQKGDFVMRHLPPMASVEPRRYAFPEIVRRRGIAQHGMVEALTQSVDDTRTSLKIHVGYPKRQKVLPSELGLHFLQLRSACVVAVHYTIKIIYLFYHT